MASEIRVSGSLSVQKRSGSTSLVDYARPFSFVADMDGSSGPYVGTVLVPVTGVAVDLTDVGTPGLCRITNQDDDNYVIAGIYDGASFFPMIELLPGESFPLRLYRHLGDEFVGTGTPADVNQLYLMANTAAVPVLLDVFPK